MKNVNGNIQNIEKANVADLVKELDEVRSFADKQIERFGNLVKIGTALSGEKDHEQLFAMIVEEAKKYTNADGCTLYIKDHEKDVLRFNVVRNDSLKIKMGGAGNEITWAPVPLKTAEMEDNHQNVSAHCAITGQAVNISDVYNADFDFQGTKDFDKDTGYRSKSMLVVPMRDHEDQVIGVIQLLNAQDRITGEVVDFPEDEIGIVLSLASQAAISLTNMRLIVGLEDLLYSIIKMVAAAIDEKSPYTAGHVQKVAEITDKLALAIHNDTSEKYAGVRFSDKELEEIRLAAWMHDVGKITTPEYVVDKATKLETIFDRVELVKYRIELLKRDVEIARLKRELAEKSGTAVSGADCQVYEEQLLRLQEACDFISKVNLGGEFLDDESLARVVALGGMELQVGEEKQPLLDQKEIENLCVRKGTLNEEERLIINNHASLSIKMLDSLPFPQKFKNVSRYAGMHHEKLDGSGYPFGLGADEIPLQARIMAVSDVFEALTAADRPYKVGKKLSEAMRIIQFMVKDNHLDGDVCDVMVESGIVAWYANHNLKRKQCDDFEWNGKKYSVADT